MILQRICRSQGWYQDSLLHLDTLLQPGMCQPTCVVCALLGHIPLIIALQHLPFSMRIAHALRRLHQIPSFAKHLV